MTVNQKKRMKKAVDRNQEDQDEEDKRKTSKLIAYLSIKHVNLSMKHAMLHEIVRQVYWRNPIICGLKLIRMVSN